MSCPSVSMPHMSQSVTAVTHCGQLSTPRQPIPGGQPTQPPGSLIYSVNLSPLIIFYATLCYALPSLCSAKLRHCYAKPSNTLPLPLLILALRRLCLSLLCNAFATPCQSMPMLCFALPLRSLAVICHALALLCDPILCRANALQNFTFALLCNSLAMLYQCYAEPNHAVAFTFPQ